MNKKIEKVREDIRKAEDKIREMEEYLKTLRAKERQLVDEEIISQIRSMQAKGGDVLDVLRKVQSMQAAPASEPKEREDMEYDA
jgi:DNA helicase TIP49 (TBP-interacting protein)